MPLLSLPSSSLAFKLLWTILALVSELMSFSTVFSLQLMKILANCLQRNKVVLPNEDKSRV